MSSGLEFNGAGRRAEVVAKSPTITKQNAANLRRFGVAEMSSTAAGSSR